MPGSEPVETYHPRSWYLIVVAVGGAVVLLVAWVFVDLPLVSVVVGPLAGAYGVSRSQRLTLSASAVTVANRSIPWEALELRSTRWGDSLRTRPGTKRLNAFLPIYESNWRSGTLAEDIERWAPHLLTPAASSERPGDDKRH